MGSASDSALVFLVLTSASCDQGYGMGAFCYRDAPSCGGGNGITFICGNTVRPTDTDATLTCGDPMPGGDATEYCCAPQNGCVELDPSPNCPSGSRTFRCGPKALPEGFKCGAPTASGNGTVDYCCTL